MSTLSWQPQRGGNWTLTAHTNAHTLAYITNPAAAPTEIHTYIQARTMDSSVGKLRSRACLCVCVRNRVQMIQRITHKHTHKTQIYQKRKKIMMTQWKNYIKIITTARPTWTWWRRWSRLRQRCVAAVCLSTRAPFDCGLTSQRRRRSQRWRCCCCCSCCFATIVSGVSFLKNCSEMLGKGLCGECVHNTYVCACVYVFMEYCT